MLRSGRVGRESVPGLQADANIDLVRTDHAMPEHGRDPSGEAHSAQWTGAAGRHSPPVMPSCRATSDAGECRGC